MKRLTVLAVLLLSAAWIESRSHFQTASSADNVRGMWPTPPVAVTSDPDLVAKIAKLRRGGPETLEQLLVQYDRAKAKQSPANKWRDAAGEQQLAEQEQIIDGVGGQKYCTKSRLFWYTDLNQAIKQATKDTKPILSLRLLGQLTDDLSCANSRFFRTTLYSNPEIAQFLRDNFVLHWTPFAPAPRITIDFGDGRQIVRTITGNSIHYVLSQNGRLIDALPGLYGPKAFLRHLRSTREFAGEMNVKWDDSKFAGYHQRRLQELAAAWHDDMQQIGEAPTSGLDRVAAMLKRSSPPAQAASSFETRPTQISSPNAVADMLRQLAELQKADNIDFWQRLAALHRADAELDSESVAMIKLMQPQAEAAGRLAMSKIAVENPMLKMVRNLIDNIALDTVRNEYALHSKVHLWLSEKPAGLEPFNDRVYAELFLMPRSDPWLGLAQPDVFAAIPNGGYVTPATTASR